MGRKVELRAFREQLSLFTLRHLLCNLRGRLGLGLGPPKTRRTAVSDGEHVRLVLLPVGSGLLAPSPRPD